MPSTAPSAAIASHGERDEEPERKQAQRDDETWEEAAGHEGSAGSRRFGRGRSKQNRVKPRPPAPARFAHRSASRGRSARKTLASVRANPPGTNPGTGFSQATTARSTGSRSGGNRPSRTE